jgi:hypothetical protein
MQSVTAERPAPQGGFDEGIGEKDLRIGTAQFGNAVQCFGIAADDVLEAQSEIGTEPTRASTAERSKPRDPAHWGFIRLQGDGEREFSLRHRSAGAQVFEGYLVVLDRDRLALDDASVDAAPVVGEKRVELLRLPGPCRVGVLVVVRT